LRSTDEPIHRFRIASAADGNGPRHEIVLAQSGAELNIEEIEKRDGVVYFPASLDLITGTAAPAGVPAGSITISPAENKIELDPGDSFSETITVTVPANAAVAKADVYFLADTTGSMTNILNAVKTGAGTILTQLNALGLDIVFGVGNYKDFPIGPGGGPYAFQHQLNPGNAAPAITAAINTWTAVGGVDTPEGQLYALAKLAQAPGGTIGWRPASKRIIVWFGDAPGHDPVCVAISGEPAAITEASVIAGLVAQSITVLAISTATPGLDDDPKAGATNYNAKCGAPAGNPGQATNIANATGGKFVSPINPANIVNTIIGLVKATVAGLNNVKLVASGATAPFVTSITPPGGYGPLPGDKESKLTFEVTFTGMVPCKDSPQVFTGTLDVVADGTVVAQKRVVITVPACKEEVAFSYSVKFVCGTQPACPCTCESLRPGVYATEIGIHNYTAKPVPIRKHVLPVVLAGAAAGREPRVVSHRAEDKIVLPPHSATMDDCCRIAELLLGSPTGTVQPLTIGFLEIVSPVAVSVTAVYTTTGLDGSSISIDVDQVVPNVVRVKRG
jgi:hypothetical protein